MAHLGIWYLNHTNLCQGTFTPTDLKASHADLEEVELCWLLESEEVELMHTLSHVNNIRPHFSF